MRQFINKHIIHNNNQKEILSLKGSLVLFLILGLAFASCKKLAEVNPPVNSLTSTSVYTEDNTAIGVLTGIYSLMNSGSFATGQNSISLEAGLSADELQGSVATLSN